MVPGSKGILPSDAGGFQSHPAACRRCMTYSFDRQLTETKKGLVYERDKVKKIKNRNILHVF